MSEIPETPTAAARGLIGWFAGGLAFQSVENLHSSYWVSGGYAVGAVAVAVIDFKLPALLAKSPQLAKSLNSAAGDARWWIGVCFVTLVMISLSPYIGQQRWPFASQFNKMEPAPPAQPGFTQSQVDEKIASATAVLTAQISELQRQLDEARKSHPKIAVPANLGPSDVATKIGVWKNIDQKMNDLAALLNHGYEMLDHSADSTKSDRLNFANNLVNLAGQVRDFRAKLSNLRDLYGTDPDISETLRATYLPGGRVEPAATIFLSLPNSLEQFANHLKELSDPVSVDLEVDLIPYNGALKRDLDAVRDWQGRVRQIAAEEDTQLSKLGKKK